MSSARSEKTEKTIDTPVSTSTPIPVTKQDQKLFFSSLSGAHVAFFRDQLNKRIKMQGGRSGAQTYAAIHVDEKKNVNNVVIKKIKDAKHSPELLITPNVNHPNILRASVLVRNQNHYLLMPKFGVGTLSDFQHVLEKPEHVNIRKYILQQMLSAIIYLAENNIRHKDLHAGNILIDENAQVKIIDFGQADHIDPSKPIFGQFIRPDDGELDTSKADSYVFCTEVLDAWRRGASQDSFLSQVCIAMKTMNLASLKNLQQQLQATPAVTAGEMQAFRADMISQNPHAPRARL